MGITNFDSVVAGSGASKRIDRNANYVFTKFYSPMTYALRAVGAPDCVALVTDAGINTLIDAEGNSFNLILEQAFAGAVPQAIASDTSGGGVALTLDAAGADGWYFDLGYGAISSEVVHTKGNFKVGTDPAFFLRVKMSVGDVSSTDQLVVGFTKGGRVADNLIATMSDFAVLNIDAGDVYIETTLNGTGDGKTDTTTNVANAGVITLEVRVDAAGKVRFFFDGVAPATDVTNFTFDDTDVVNAFVACQVAGDNLNPLVVIEEWESGYISSRGLNNIGDLAGNANLPAG